MYSPCPPSVPVSVPIPILHILPLYLPYLPHIPSLIHLTRKTGNVEEKQGYNGNTGTGTMMQETSCTILQKPLRKPPVPAHPPIKETCAFSQYGSILRTKKEPLQQQLSFPSNINFLNYRSLKSSPASYPSVSRSSVPASWSATSGAAASCSSSRPSRRSPDTIS